MTQQVVVAQCTGSHGDVAILNAALSSGASKVIVPLGAIGYADGLVTVPDNVELCGPGTLKRAVIAALSTSGGAEVYRNTIPMTAATSALVGSIAYDQTLGFKLPGVVSSVNPGISFTMTMQVGNSAAKATSSSSASSSNILTFASGPPPLVIEGHGMTAYNVTNGQVLGTVNKTTPTTVIMDAALGSTVNQGDIIQFGYPVTAGDVIVFGNYADGMINLGNGSKLSNITIDDSNFVGSVNQYAVGAFNVNDWIIDGAYFNNLGLYGVQYNNTKRGRISHNRFEFKVPSNKNNNSSILGYGDINTPGGISTVIDGNFFSGAGVITADYNLSCTNNEFSDYIYGCAIFNVNSTIWSPAKVTGNYIHDSGTLPDSNNTIPFGIGAMPPCSDISHNIILRMGGPGVYVLGQNTGVGSNMIFDCGRGAARAGIVIGYVGPNVYLNGSYSSVSNNQSGGFLHATQSFGYQDEVGVVGATLLGNRFLNNSVAPYQINAGTTVAPY